jgi:hypothetical protein
LPPLIQIPAQRSHKKSGNGNAVGQYFCDFRGLPC